MKQRLNFALWFGQVFLAAFFLAAAYAHGMLPIEEAAKSAPWVRDVPAALVRGIAVLELAGGLGVLLPSLLRVLPRLAPLAAAGLALLMLSAVCFHLSRGEVRIIGMHILVGWVAAVVAWARFSRVPILPR